MSVQGSSQDQEIRASLKTLIRGLTQGNLEEGYEGYKALFKIGAPAIPQIKDAIFKSNWSQVKRPNEIRYVSGLVTLLRDINEVEADAVVKQLIDNGCDITVKQLVTSICRFTLADYLTYDIRGINNTWSGGGTLELPDGRKFPATTNLWKINLEFKTEAGETLVRFKTSGLVHLSATVEIQPDAAVLSELPWVIMFGWYLTVMLYMDTASVAAM